jgi:hypothetical protein
MSKTPSKALHNLTPREWLQLESFIWLNIRSRKITRLHVAAMLRTYATQYSLPAMYRYFHSARAQGEEPRAILATIAHDLNGRHQSPAKFTPHTSAY